MISAHNSHDFSADGHPNSALPLYDTVPSEVPCMCSTVGCTPVPGAHGGLKKWVRGPERLGEKASGPASGPASVNRPTGAR